MMHMSSCHLTFWPRDDLWPHHPHHLTFGITQGSFVPSVNKIDAEIEKWEQVKEKLSHKTLTFFRKKMMRMALHHLTFWPLDDLWPHHPHHLTSGITQGSFVPSLNKIDSKIEKWEQVKEKLSHKTLTFL